MFTYSAFSNAPDRFLSLCGVPVEDFLTLLPTFEIEFENYMRYKTFNKKRRLNKYTQKKKGILETIEDKLFFILCYMKNNLTQEFCGACFGMEQEMANKWIHTLLPIAQKSLSLYAPAERIEDLSPTPLIIIDATERRIQRSVYDQQIYFSGKKKAHTVKNIAAVTPNRKIPYIGPTEVGTKHDKILADDMRLPKDIDVYADLGFLGLKKTHPKVQMPHKKPKNKELSEEQKQENTEFSRKRVVVEHVFSSVKILRIVKDVCRNYKFGFLHAAFKFACTLHNFKVEQKYQKQTCS
jgi:DDE superfamily endonuclease/Helix-turn-helix of DDE superfamily endonuclease